MKIQKSISAVAGLVLGLSAASSVVASEEKYPAAEFKPTVIYSNAELVAQTSSGTASVSAPAHMAAVAVDPKYPAAYFNPVILYPAK